MDTTGNEEDVSVACKVSGIPKSCWFKLLVFTSDSLYLEQRQPRVVQRNPLLQLTLLRVFHSLHSKDYLRVCKPHPSIA